MRALKGSRTVYGPQFTIPVPTVVNTGTFARTHISQPGSRIFYVDPVSGTNTTDNATTIAKAMFWNGTNLIDASGSTTGAGSVLYGTDPLNPSGPINTVRTLACCLPRSDGSDVGSTSGTIGPVTPAGKTRSGFPDWFLVKRVTTLDIDADRTTWATASGGSQPVAGLNIAAGVDATHRSILSCYGDPLSQFRPKFINATATIGDFFSLFNVGHNFSLVTGLWVDGGPRGVSTARAMGYLSSNASDLDVNFEDCWFYRTAAEVAIGNGGTVESPYAGGNGWKGGIRFEGCIFTDAWGAGKLQGMYLAGAAGSRFKMKNNIFIRCGHNVDPTIQSPFNPDGTGWLYGGFAGGNRNAYISGECDTANSSVDFNIFLCGASGFQNRCGAPMHGNFLYEGYANVGAASGYPPGTTSTGDIVDNWLQRLAPPADGSGGVPANVPGWGWQFGGGFYGGNFQRNVFSQAQWATGDYSGGMYGFSLASIIDDPDVPLHRATTNNNISANIFDAVYGAHFGGDPQNAVYETDGATSAEFQWQGPITGWGNPSIVGTVLTCTPIPGYTGAPSYQWMKDAVNIGGATSSTYTMVLGDLTATNYGIRCKVTGITYAAGNTPGLSGNVFTNNVITAVDITSNSRRVTTFAPTGVTGSATTDTAYSSNRLYTALATAKSTEGWTDETRTLKSYLQSIGQTISTADGVQEFYNLVIAQQRGTNSVALWDGRKILNHLRAGRGMSAL